MSFDASSGLVYTERTSAQVRSMVPTWMTYTRGKKENPLRYRRSGIGSSSLKQMTLRSCAFNIDLFAPEALQWLGWHYASKIYYQLKNTDTLSFNAWSIFNKAFPEQIDHNHQFFVCDNEPSSDIYGQPVILAQLPSVANRLAKLDTTTLSFLYIQQSPVIFSHLLTLIQLDTLASLVLEEGDAMNLDLDDMRERQIKNWGRAVSEKGAFKRLKVLVLYSPRLHRGLLLQAVSKFPVLALVGTDGWREPRSRACETDTAWRALPGSSAEKDSLPALDQDPRTIWTNPRMTTGQKMEQLHDLANKISQRPSPGIATMPTVTLLYTSNSNRSHLSNKAAWYFRDQTEETPASSKRSGESQGPQPTASDTKKRKIRNAKKADVASILGGFT